MEPICLKGHLIHSGIDSKALMAHVRPKTNIVIP